MLDIKFIRENKDLVALAGRKKHLKFDVEELIALDEKRRHLLAAVEKRRAEQNAASAGIASAATPGTPWHFSQTPCVVNSAPVPDQHTNEVLGRVPAPAGA